MLEFGSEIQEMDLRIQWSLITRVKAAARVYKAACAGGSTESLANYLSALESLSEYVATRCRGVALFEEVQVTGRQDFAEPPLAKAKKRGPKLIPFMPQAEAPEFAAARDLSCESLAG
jgi:hypothetical protein